MYCPQQQRGPSGPRPFPMQARPQKFIGDADDDPGWWKGSKKQWWWAAACCIILFSLVASAALVLGALAFAGEGDHPEPNPMQMFNVDEVALENSLGRQEQEALTPLRDCAAECISCINLLVLPPSEIAFLTSECTVRCACCQALSSCQTGPGGGLSERVCNRGPICTPVFTGPCLFIPTESGCEARGFTFP